MDSKHRHELEQNELAKWMTAQYEDWIRPNSSWLGYAILGVLVIVAVVMVTARINAWNQATAWKQFYAALQSEEELETMANSTSGTIGVQARLALAQRQLAEGCSQVFIDKAQSIVALEKAITSFLQVQKKTSDPSLLQQAGFGLGQCWETLAAARVGDDLTKAEAEYEKVVQLWEEGFTGQRAKKQLALIRQPSTKMFIELTAAKTIEPSGAGDSWLDMLDFTDSLTPAQIDFGTFEETQNVATDGESESDNVEPDKEPGM